MNNAVYGKTTKNMRKGVKKRIAKNSKEFIKYTSKSTCVRWNLYDEKLATIHERNYH